MKVTTDACLFGGWVAAEIQSGETSAKNILDIGTGTGLLALMVAQKNPAVIINAIEIDDSAAAQAKENIASSPWNVNVHIIHGDVKIYPFTKKYDYIISNPPFYENELKSKNEGRNIALHHEGLVIDELFSLIKNNLKPDGYFSLLMPFKRSDEVDVLLKKNKLFLTKKLFVRQSPNHDYFRIIIKGGLEPQTSTISNEISIKNENEHYTPEFDALLKDYYLFL
jgi:tRNA1Val (adenine37-N6)-methyltransferase